jgi:anti-sigma B factor antagonist
VNEVARKAPGSLGSKSRLRLRHTTLGLRGELDQLALAELGDRLLRLLDQSCVWVLLDFSAVEHLDYRGVPQLVARAEAFRRAGGDLKVCGLSPYLQAVLRAGGAHGAFEVFHDASDARAAMTSPFERPE